MRSSGSSTDVPTGLWSIAGSGLIPFVVRLGRLFTTPELSQRVVHAFIAYAALTLSFLGGARWGAEPTRVPNAPSLGRLMAAALPMLRLMACGLAQLALGRRRVASWAAAGVECARARGDDNWWYGVQYCLARAQAGVTSRIVRRHRRSFHRSHFS